MRKQVLLMVVWCSFWMAASGARAQVPTPLPQTTATPTPTALQPLPTATPTANTTPTPTQAPNESFSLISSRRTLIEGSAVTLTLAPVRRLNRTVTFRLRAGIAARGNDNDPDGPLLASRSFTFTPTTTRVSFTLSAPDERIAYGSNAYVRFVTDGALVSPFDAIDYQDNDPLNAALLLDRSTIREGNVDGGRAIATVVSNGPSSLSAFDVRLSSDDPSLLLSNIVSLNAVDGQKRFAAIITTRSDDQTAEPRTATISATVRGFETVERTLTVVEKDAPALRLLLAPSAPQEGQSTLVTVRREGDLSRPVTVQLTRTSGANDLSPARDFWAVATLTLQAGQATAQARVTLEFDGLLFRNSERIELLRAQAQGLVSAVQTVYVANTEPLIETRVSPDALREGAQSASGTLLLRLSQPFVRDVPLRIERFGRRLRLVFTEDGLSLRLNLPASGAWVSVPFVVRNNDEVDAEADGGTTREGFVFQSPFRFNDPFLSANSDESSPLRRVFINIADDEVPLSLRFISASTFDTVAFNTQLRLDVAQASSVAREFVLRLDNGREAREFLLLLPARQQTFTFPLPFFVIGSNGVLRAVISPRDAPRSAAAAMLSNVIAASANAIIAENGPPVAVTLSRFVSDVSREETFTLERSNLSRIELPRRVTFARGQHQATIVVRPLNNQVLDGDLRIFLYGYGGSGGGINFSVMLIDDETDSEPVAQTPSDVSLLRASIFTPSPAGANRVGVTLTFDGTVRGRAPLSTAFSPQAFLVRINGVLKNPVQEFAFINPDSIELVLEDSSLRPGARLSITLLSIVDAQGRFLAPVPINLTVPSVLPQRGDA